MEHDVKFSRTKDAVTTAMLNLEIMKDEYAQVRNSERKKAKGNKGESTPATSESLEAAKSAYKKSHTGCRCHEDCRYDGRSKGL
jgi:hypothetical protein